ncbi:MAG: MFS transporter [Phycisphaerae bacterium]|nr:MFS transporter [Phycisphaerae bacterium]
MTLPPATTSTVAVSADLPPEARRGRRGFVALLATQFLGAANDNVMKGVLGFAVAAGGVWSGSLGPGGQGWVGLCLTLPFILFSGFGGALADRLSKRTLTVWLKVAEVAICLLAAWAFAAGLVWFAVLSMILMATQSAFFGPAKYGMIPELVRDEKLSAANGTINLLTNLAIIVGTIAAGPIYDLFAPPVGEGAAIGLEQAVSTDAAWLPGAVMLAVAVPGIATALAIPRLRAMAPALVLEWNPFGTYWRSLREMRRGPLLPVTAAWSFFYLLGMLVLLILPDYRELLGISAAVAARLLGVVAISIGVGSVIAGLASGALVRPGMAPFGALGMSLSMVALGLAPRDPITVGVLLVPLGISAGFYIVPLQAMLQRLSPEESRGRFLGTANAVSFLASSLASLVFLGCRHAGLAADRVFLVGSLGALVAAAGVGAWWWTTGRRQTAGRLGPARRDP